MVDILQYKLEKEYYKLDEACDIVNKEFNLNENDKVIRSRINYLRKNGYIDIGNWAGKNVTKIHRTELLKLVGITYLTKVIGIPLDKMDHVTRFLSNPLNYPEFISYSQLYKKFKQ